MKKTYLLIFVSMITAASYAQSLGRTVFNSIGGMMGTPGSVQMLVSVGEPIIGMIDTKDASLSQGFYTGSKAIVATTTGVDELAKTENATVYPNPFSSHILINSLADNIHVYVFNMMGQEVYSAPYQSTGADLSTLSAGVYVVHAMSNEKTILNTKILKQ